MATKFKSARVGKDSNLMEEIEKLPENLKYFWRTSQFHQFLRAFIHILSDPPNLTATKRRADYTQDIIQILPFLSELGKSFDWKVHRLIRMCYELCDDGCTELLQSLARSSNKYVINILWTGTTRELLSYYIDPYQFITWCLNFSCVPDVLRNAIDEQTLNVSFVFDSDLKRSALEFMDKLFIYPLDLEILKFLKLPGVYFIYYVGETELYIGSQVSPSTYNPVYVGKSKNNIGDRLRDHYQKIEAAKNLHLTDFVVRFMILNNEFQPPIIEKMLIELFCPVWNRESEVQFSFGNANSETNTWNKFHIQVDEETIKTMLEKLRIG
ncbi:hypothetical protein OS493_037169 [Desmophyllum pertusum]|uniref:GIY-YIG domain-containing protein n=1 Tax=Desmophyllum pertusum TaxID=174260 RepID=A0A9X0CUI3_9CNID|nr:hypothetical protein OS493_037169 [Desmophyllum pertusum]